MLEVGDTAPLEAKLWRTPAEETTLGEIVAEGPILLLFYLFDWTGT